MTAPDDEARQNRGEHARFLLYQIQQELGLAQGNKDLVMQCEDGDYLTSAAVILAMAPGLQPSLSTEDNPVIIVPGLQVGELLLFFKYVFSNKVEDMFNKEDIVVIEKVCGLLNVHHYFPQPVAVETSVVIDFKCQECPSFHGTERKLTKHYLLDHPELAHNILYACESCPEIFSAEEILNEHINKSHKSSGSKADFKLKRMKQQQKLKSEVVCKLCSQKIGFSLLCKHVKQKHPDREYTCWVCVKNCDTKQELEEHLQEHSGEDSEYYLMCERCDKVCISQYQLQLHRRGHNIKNFESLACQFCDRVFQVKNKLEKHVEKHKSGELDKIFKCPQCDKVFKKQTELDRHTKLTHMGVKDYKCEVCGSRFGDSTRLKQHKWIHADLKQFKCPHENCSQNFRHKSHLRSHISSIHPDSASNESKLSCTWCNRKFAFEYKLQKHLAWHRMDNIERVECDQTEYSVSNMNIVGNV